MDSIDNVIKSSDADSLDSVSLDEEQKNANFDLQAQDEETLMKDVLEKLDLTTESKKDQDIQEKCLPKIDLNKDLQIDNNTQSKNPKQIEVENAAAQEFIKIQNLAKLGLINSLQEQNLKDLVLKKAFDRLIQNEKQDNSTLAVRNNDKNTLFAEFSKDNPDFFKTGSRKEVFDYLNSEDVQIGKNDLKKISELVENIEKSAVERYLKKLAYEKTVNESNIAAKQKLTSNAQFSKGQSAISRVFTREQIGKMSGTEFIKNESMIMEQLKKGLIR